MRKLLIGILVITLVLILIKKKNMTWRESILKAVYPIIMLPGKLFGGTQKGSLNSQNKIPQMDFYQLSFTLNNGQTASMEQFKGKKVLLVNTASACGYTGQYAELEELYKKYKEQLVIIGFPANDFKQQEQKNDKEIAAFCKVNYGISFLLAQKSSVVKGADMALEAGCDAVLICNRPDLADQLLSQLKVSEAKQAESAIRLNRLMPTATGPAWDELQGEAQYQHAKGLLQQLKLIA